MFRPISEYLQQKLDSDSCLGFDGRVVDWNFGHELEEQYHLRFDRDLVDEIWPDRPQIQPSAIYPPAAFRHRRIRKG